MKREGTDQPPDRILKMDRARSALLYNLLTDNAQSWNAPLREQLTAVVTRTESFHARVAVKEGTLPEFLERGSVS